MTKDLNYPDLEQICRLCLKEEQVSLVEIFPNNKKDNETVKQLSIPMRIMACAALEVQSSDGLPKSICAECRYQLEKYFYFRKRAQLADNKLRKHLRLLSLGKKSTVFVKRAKADDDVDDDDDEEELEFEDSLKFIKEKEELRDKDRLLLLKEKLQLELQKEFLKEKKLYEEKVNKIQEEKTSKLKKALEIELRQKLQHECLEEAKATLRVEMKEQCRQEEIDILQHELELFLAERRQHKIGNNSTAQVPAKALTKSNTDICDESDWLKQKSEIADNKSKNVSSNSRNMRKRVRSPEVLKAAKSTNSEENTDITVVAESNDEFDYITNEEEVIVDGGVSEIEAPSNFYLINKQGDEETYVASEDSNQHYEAGDIDENSLTDTAFYQIVENGDIQTLDSKSSIHFNVDQADDGEDAEELEYETCDLLEYMNIKPTRNQVKNNNNKNKLNENKECIKKLKLDQTTAHDDNANLNIDLVQDDSITTPLKWASYSRPTDTPKTFKCGLCPMLFSTENTLNRHYRTHVQSEKRGVNYTCNECNVIFSCKSALTRHAVIHTGQRPYKCKECGKGFVQREILKRHQQVHTGERPCQCPYCPRAYTQKVNLTQHINQHHSNTPKVKQHSCHLCDKRFNHASGLSRHLTSHSGIHYQCMECEKKFVDRSSIKRHIAMVHCKESPGELIKEYDNTSLKSVGKAEDDVTEI